MKTCSHCKKEKATEKFHKNKSHKDRLTSNCKECKLSQKRIYYSKNKEKINKKAKEYYYTHEKRRKLKDQEYYSKNKEKINQRHKEYYYKYKYGISLQEKREMYYKQDGKCLGCEKEMLTTRDCHVDHDHKTNRVRGLLCYRCNVLIGFANDNPIILESLALYLRNSYF